MYICIAIGKVRILQKYNQETETSRCLEPVVKSSQTIPDQSMLYQT